MRFTANRVVRDGLLGLIPFIVFFAIWWLLSSKQLLPHWLLPPPGRVFATLWELCINGIFGKLLYVSVLNVLPPFFVAFIVAIAIGILIGQQPIIARIIMPFLAAFYPIPSLAWLPLIILFSGFMRWSIWILIFFATFLRMVYSVVSSVQSLNQGWLLVAKNYRLSRMATVTRIIIPGTLPYLLGTARTSFGTAWRALIGAEMLVATLGGLGRFIWQAQWFFNFEYVLSGIIVIGLIGVLAEICIFGIMEKHILRRWGLNNEQLS